jgi:hypothetical protein
MRGAKTFEPISTNGSQRGGRPIFALLPHRIQNVAITGGQERSPVVTDTFVLVPQPKEFDPASPITITFTADRAE